MPRTVGELRPRPGLALDPEVTVASAARKMAAASTDCALIVGAELRGILTDTDVARKVIALGLDPEVTAVTEAMTAAPKCVRVDDSAVDALTLMVERRFRHLPVLDAQGAVVGVLDIAKCLYDAISRFERHVASASSAMSAAVLAALPQGATAGAGSAQQLVDGMVAKLFSPSLGDLLEHSGVASVGPEDSAHAAAVLMAARRSAVLVSSPAEPCIGILTPKDLLTRLVGRGLPAQTTSVSTLMTRAPDTMPASATVLQALHQLQYGGYRNVPVISERGEPLGVLDILTLMQGAMQRQKQQQAPSPADGGGGAATQQAWRGLLSETLGSARSGGDSRPPSLPSRPSSQMDAPAASNSGPAAASNSGPAGGSSVVSGAAAVKSFLFKVNEPGGAAAGCCRRSESRLAPLAPAPRPRAGRVCTARRARIACGRRRRPTGRFAPPPLSVAVAGAHMHRIHAAPNDLAALIAAVRAKLVMAADGSSCGTLVLRYDDDEGDRVIITSDEELQEAVTLAMGATRERLVLYSAIESAAGSENVPPAGGAGAPGVAVRQAGAPVAITDANSRAAAPPTMGSKSQERLLGASLSVGLAALILGASSLARR